MYHFNSPPTSHFTLWCYVVMVYPKNNVNNNDQIRSVVSYKKWKTKAQTNFGKVKGKYNDEDIF